MLDGKLNYWIGLNSRSDDENDEILRAQSFMIHHKTEDMEVPEFRGHDCSYDEVDKIPQNDFATKWGPVSFSSTNHPLSIMVRCDHHLNLI